MSADTPRLIAHRDRTGGTPSGGATTPLSDELQHDLGRRLAVVALCYSGVYLIVFATGLARMVLNGHAPPSWPPHVTAAVPIALGLMVFLTARKGHLSTDALANLTLTFQVVGALGIAANSWGWEREFDMYQRHVFNTIGSAEIVFPEGFVDALLASHMRIIYVDGVSWVGVWLLVVPILVPMSPRRTLLGVFLAACTIPAVTLLSPLVNGLPPSVAPWLDDLFLDTAIPTFICAGLAWFAAHTVYRLTVALSRAQRLGSYRLEERIGSGGMGEVWRARHRLLARPAAIKLIRPGMAGGEEVVRRFEREAQATAALQSPHTVELYDFGVTPEGTFYYVMELLDGYDLQTLVDRFGPLPAARAIHLLRQACHSLEEAHRAGLVHRDVKPSNILACRLGRDHDFVKVFDFGLVKTVHGSQNITATDVARGTPAFMAPEAVTGESPVDARSDIYALGCVGFWLLTGRLVFEGANAMGTLLKHVNEPPPSINALRAEPVPESLERLIMDCLAKDPATRPPSADEVAERLILCAETAGSWSRKEAEAWWIAHAPAPVTSAPIAEA